MLKDRHIKYGKGLWRIMLLAHMAIMSVYANNVKVVLAPKPVGPHMHAKAPGISGPVVDKSIIPSGHMLPTGFSPQVGSVTMHQPSPTQMVFDQKSHAALANFTSFDIGPGHRVDVHQPASSSIFAARVSGPDPSVLIGTLKANGNVWLMNRSGIVVGDGSKIDANFLGTTKNVRTEDFIKGKYVFQGDSQAKIILKDNVTFAAPGKWVALAANHIVGEETLLLAAPSHRLILAGVEAFSLDVDGSGLFGFKVHPANAPHDVSVQLKRQSAIKAEDAYVLLTTQNTLDVVKGVIQTDGIIEATKITTDKNTGIIRLEGGVGTTTSVKGKLTAYGKGVQGGGVYITGTNVDIKDTARMDVSGDKGGGTVAIGGLSEGLRNSLYTNVDAGVELKADAVQEGNGGSIGVWGTKGLRFKAKASARGGSIKGNGGFMELSTFGALDINEHGFIDLRATASNGKSGTLLIDPATIVIRNGGGLLPPGSVQILVNTILQELLGGNVIYRTSAQAGLQANNVSNIMVLSDLNLSGINNTNALTLEAGHQIHVQAPITLGTHDLYLKSGLDTNSGSGQSILFGGPGRLRTTGSANAGKVYLYYHNNGIGTPPTDFLPNIVDTTTGNPTPGRHVAYRWITDQTDWNNMILNWNQARMYNYALRSNITVSQTEDIPQSSFSGYFDGNNKTIILNHSDGGGQNNMVSGLFKEVDNNDLTIPTIQNLTVNFGTYSNPIGNTLGGLVNYLVNGYIKGNTIIINNLTALSQTGGLIGIFVNGRVSDNAVSSSGNLIIMNDILGGLVGSMHGGILSNNTFSSGALMSGNNYVGGMIGEFEGGLADGNTVNVISLVGRDHVGGLFGRMSGTARNNRLSRIPNITSNGYFVGGLVGHIRDLATFDNTNRIITTATSQSNGAYIRGVGNVGALVGLMEAGTLQNYAPGYVFISGSGYNVGGMVGAISGGNLLSNTLRSYIINNGLAEGTGGLIGRIAYVGGRNISIQGNNNQGAIRAINSSVSSVGGIAGLIDSVPMSYFLGTNTWNIDATPIQQGPFNQNASNLAATSYYIGILGGIPENISYQWILENGAILRNGRSAPPPPPPPPLPKPVQKSSDATSNLANMDTKTGSESAFGSGPTFNGPALSPPMPSVVTSSMGQSQVTFDALNMSSTTLPSVVVTSAVTTPAPIATTTTVSTSVVTAPNGSSTNTGTSTTTSTRASTGTNTETRSSESKTESSTDANAGETATGDGQAKTANTNGSSTERTQKQKDREAEDKDEQDKKDGRSNPDDASTDAKVGLTEKIQSQTGEATEVKGPGNESKERLKDLNPNNASTVVYTFNA